ncbi:MAG: hypothetical protein GY714_00010 [Desulfobacterales bacterium]|nr:hypothetical protein [Desulfobacterales bacterium]
MTLVNGSFSTIEELTNFTNCSAYLVNLEKCCVFLSNDIQGCLNVDMNRDLMDMSQRYDLLCFLISHNRDDDYLSTRISMKDPIKALAAAVSDICSCDVLYSFVWNREWL